MLRRLIYYANYVTTIVGSLRKLELFPVSSTKEDARTSTCLITTKIERQDNMSDTKPVSFVWAQALDAYMIKDVTVIGLYNHRTQLAAETPIKVDVESHVGIINGKLVQLKKNQYRVVC